MVLKISRFGKNRENREIKTAFIMYTTGGGGGGGRRVWLGGVLKFFEGKSGDGKDF